MWKLVDDDEVLKLLALIIEVDRWRDRAGCRTGAPFPHHALYANDS